jgi:hypothetical protein
MNVAQVSPRISARCGSTARRLSYSASRVSYCGLTRSSYRADQGQEQEQETLWKVRRAGAFNAYLRPDEGRIRSPHEGGMAKLKATTRNQLPASEFGLPKQGKYPMENRSHQIAAKGRLLVNVVNSLNCWTGTNDSCDYPELLRLAKGHHRQMGGRTLQACRMAGVRNGGMDKKSLISMLVQ